MLVTCKAHALFYRTHRSLCSQTELIFSRGGASRGLVTFSVTSKPKKDIEPDNAAPLQARWGQEAKLSVYLQMVSSTESLNACSELNGK